MRTAMGSFFGTAGVPVDDPERPGQRTPFVLVQDNHDGRGRPGASTAGSLVRRDDHLSIAFEGALTNADELRAGLALSRDGAGRGDDRAVSLALYEKYGPAFIHLLRGSFTLAVWDASLNRLCLARDPLGTRALYYSRSETPFAFSTDLGSILALPWISREADPLGILDYLAVGGTMPPRTMHRDVRKLAAGHMLVTQPGRVSITRYWAPVLSEVERRLSREAIVEEWEEQVSTILARQRQDTVVCLDEGPGSRVLASQLARVSPDARTDCIAFDDATGETSLALARRLSEHLRCAHEERRVGSGEAHRDLVDMIRRGVMPGDEGAVLEYRRFREAASSGRAALRGEGGTALLGARDWRGHALPGTPRERGGSDVAWPDQVFPERALAGMWADPPVVSTWRETLAGDLARAAEGGGDDETNRAIAIELGLMIPETRIAVLSGLGQLAAMECRYPCLDRDLVDTMNAQGPRAKADRRSDRALWGQLVRRHLPEWARTSGEAASSVFPSREVPAFARAVLERERVRRCGYFDPSAVAKLVEGYQRGLAGSAARLWRVLGVQLWHEHASTGD